MVSVSQPVDASLSQLPKPVEQITVHSPLVQLAVPCAAPQTFPHVPQFETSFDSCASHPSEYLPLQSEKPGEQPPTLHVALTHVPIGPLATTQELTQLPQRSGSMVVLVSHPFFASLSQLPYPGAHVIVQNSYAQEGMPLLLSHTLPQAPQLLTLLAILASQPSAAVLLQS